MIEYEANRMRNLIKVMRDHNEFPLDLPRYCQPFSNHPVSRALREVVGSVQKQLRSRSEVELKVLHSSVQWHWQEMVSVERLLEGSERELESMAVCLIAD